MGDRFQLVRVMLTSLASTAVILAVAGGTAMPPVGEAGSGAVVLAPPPSPTTVTLQAVADAYVDNGAPTTNYSGSAYLFASLYGEFSNVQQTLVRFNLRSIPADASVQSAQPRLYQQAGSGLSSVTLHLGRAGSSSTEYGGTFNTRPTLYLVSLTAVSTSTGWKSWDATSLVSAWLNGTYASYGVASPARWPAVCGSASSPAGRGVSSHNWW